MSSRSRSRGSSSGSSSGSSIGNSSGSSSESDDERNFLRNLTVTILMLEKSRNYKKCKKILDRECEKLGFVMNEFEGVKPLPNALNKMLEMCKTYYLLQVDDDMLLYEGCIRVMYETALLNFVDGVVCVTFPLHDKDFGTVGDIKLFNMKLLRKCEIMFLMKIACDRELFRLLIKKKRYWCMKKRDMIVGEHDMYRSKKELVNLVSRKTVKIQRFQKDKPALGFFSYVLKHANVIGKIERAIDKVELNDEEIIEFRKFLEKIRKNSYEEMYEEMRSNMKNIDKNMKYKLQGVVLGFKKKEVDRLGIF